jgi:hypothetical protein
MFRLVIALTVAVLGAFPALAQNLTEDEKKDGFISLFNGKDFANWRFGSDSALGKLPPNWKVDDGLIKLSGGASPHLASQWDYDDFEARLEWRAVKANYNSGFYVRSGRNVGANQINLAKGDEGHLMGGASGGVKVPQLQKPFGEWNEWKVLAVGDSLTFWANGQQGWKVNGFKPARGYLGLQAEGHMMEFRNIRVKELGYKLLNKKEDWQGIPSFAKEWIVTDNILPLGKLGLLTSKAKLKNYVVRFEWKGEKGDGGPLGTVGVRGNDGGVLVYFGHGDSVPGSVKLGKETPAIPKKNLANPVDQWNYLEIRVQGKDLSVWLNGTTVQQLTLAEGVPDMAPLSLHSSGVGLEVKNLRIKELK